jgi:hypothetical protein
MSLDDLSEKYYLTVISNLLKSINFLELLQLKDTEQISEKEFEEELGSNFDRYSIKIADFKNLDDRPVIMEIARKMFEIMEGIGMEDISADRMAQLFSLESGVFDAEERDNV